MTGPNSTPAGTEVKHFSFRSGSAQLSLDGIKESWGCAREEDGC